MEEQGEYKTPNAASEDQRKGLPEIQGKKKCPKKKFFMFMHVSQLSQFCQPISLGIVSDCGKSFYAQFDDFTLADITEWTQLNVVSQFRFSTKHFSSNWFNAWKLSKQYNPKVGFEEAFPLVDFVKSNDVFEMSGATDYISRLLKEWLVIVAGENNIRFVTDDIDYQWTSLMQLFGGALGMPGWICPYKLDLNWVLESEGMDWFEKRGAMLSKLGVKGINTMDAVGAAWAIKIIFENIEKLKNLSC